MSAPENFAETLYRIIPALYRQRDETGDLRAFFEGCGELLDAIYATLRQRHADNFPDNPPDGATMAPAQDWLLPYFADLVDAVLVSPLPDGRRDELANAIRWRQGKGTLNTIDSVVEAIGQTQAVVQEGWRRVAITPRIGQPLGTAVSYGYPQEPEPACPGNMARHPNLPAATVDVRCPSRALGVDESNPGLQQITIDEQPKLWRQGSWHGAPCFPGSYEDVSRRTPDMRTPDWRVGHFHPRRILAFLPPPSGFFPPNAQVVNWQATPSANYRNLIEIDDGTPGVVIHRNKSLGTGAFVPVIVQGAADLDNADSTGAEWHFEGISFRNDVFTADARLHFTRSAVRRASTGLADLNAPAIRMQDCLTAGISAPGGLVQLVGVTVLGATIAAAIQASEALLTGHVHRDGDDTQAPVEGGCIRFSRVEPTQPKGDLHYWELTTEAPTFFRNVFGQRHSGVLSPATHEAILNGAEDEGEIGAFHHARHAAIRDAIVTKLNDFLPVGQEVVLIPDTRLTEPAWPAP